MAGEDVSPIEALPLAAAIVALAGAAIAHVRERGKSPLPTAVGLLAIIEIVSRWPA